MDNIITVFTPTYNRKRNLEKCYTSLVNQTTKNFIWQVIDDGSTDETEELIQEWINDKKIKITYKRKLNGGKASCINLSLDISNTPLWMCLDSDDYLMDNAIEIINKTYELDKNKENICGMFALRSNPDGSPMQNISIPDSNVYTTQAFVRYSLGIPPEYVHIFKTKIIKKYKYPIISGEKYMPLSYVFDQVDQQYSYRVLIVPIMVCEYQSDGMTKNKRLLIKKNPEGYKMYKKQAIIFAPNWKEKIKAAITYNTACIIGESKGCISDSPNKLLTIASYPFGLADYLLRYSKI